MHGVLAERAQRSRDMSNERNGKCHRREDEETQLLSMRVILEHLLDSSTLLVKVGKLLDIAFISV